MRSRLIILINKEINEVNGPDKIVAEKKYIYIYKINKKSRRKKKTAKKKISAQKKKNLWGGGNNEANWMVSNSTKLDRRTKQHTQFGVSASNGSRDMARTKSWRKKRKKLKKKKITKRIGW